jgi:hypothetical protein
LDDVADAGTLAHLAHLARTRERFLDEFRAG